MKKTKSIPELLKDLYLKEPTNEHKLLKLTNAYVKKSEQLDKINSEIEIINKKKNKELFEFNKLISDSNKLLFEDIKNKKKLIDSYSNGLINANIKYQPYYHAIERIYFNGDFTSEEKDFVMELGFNKKIGSWYYAFCILAYRYRNNEHFISLFHEKKREPLNYKDLSSLEYYSEIFNNQRNKLQNKRNKNKIKK